MAAAFATSESSDFLDDLAGLDLVPQLPGPRDVTQEPVLLIPDREHYEDGQTAVIVRTDGITLMVRPQD